MADVDIAQGGGGKGQKKSALKKTSTKVDMTPMVDLAFLLVTFFMLTTTMNKPQTMEITMPDRQKGQKQETMKVKESRTVTVLLGEKDRVYYYQGLPTDDADVRVTNYSAEGIRKALLEKKREIGTVRVKGQTGGMEVQDGIIVLIKAMDTAKYRNMVDILDEMNITKINTYAIVDITDHEKDMMAKADAKAGVPQGPPVTTTSATTGN